MEIRFIKVKKVFIITLFVGLLIFNPITWLARRNVEDGIANVSGEKEDVLENGETITKIPPESTKEEIKGHVPTIQVQRVLPQRKLVHLDLKGAPPKMSYLLTLLPIFKSLGATGLLVEYEDMFPYYGKLSVLKSNIAYNFTEISIFLKNCRWLDLEVIPLVQTLGHFEYAMKHPAFYDARETKRLPNMICPSNPRAIGIVTEMIDQVLKHHPHITNLHLGGDEAYNLQSCPVCRKSNMTKAGLYLHHMLPLFRHVSTKTNLQVRPIIWDDMLRRWSIKELENVAALADIMVWAYVPNLSYYFTEGMWTRYKQIFKAVWVASAFKGAKNPNTDSVPIMHHIQNQESWIRTTNEANVPLLGIVLTGWSRFDHFAVMCELLPPALPSLGLCLGVLNKGSFDKTIKDEVESKLGFSYPISISESSDSQLPDYPGGDVYNLIYNLEIHRRWYKMLETALDSWANDRMMKEGKISLLHLSPQEVPIMPLISRLAGLRNKCRIVLSQYFHDNTVNEWIIDKVDSLITLAGKLGKRLKNIKKMVRKKHHDSLKNSSASLIPEKSL